MFCLESRDTMPASNEEILEAEEENVGINPSWGPKEVTVNDKGEVTGIIFKKCLRTIDPETGKFSPVYDENETVEIKADKIVFAIGRQLNGATCLRAQRLNSGTAITLLRTNSHTRRTIPTYLSAATYLPVRVL